MSADQVRKAVTELRDSVPHLRHTLLVSADGLLTAASPELGRASGDRLAAIVSSMCSLTRGIAREFGSAQLKQSIIELESEYLFLMRVDDTSVLAVIADIEADVAAAGGAMARLVPQLAGELTPDVVTQLRASLPSDPPGTPT